MLEVGRNLNTFLALLLFVKRELLLQESRSDSVKSLNERNEFGNFLLSEAENKYSM